MLAIRFKNKEILDIMHKALAGSDCYINSDVALIKDPLSEEDFILAIGEPNGNDTTIDLIS